MSTRPNILVIITDQQHYRMMSCTGNRWVRTPTMDRIAREGVRFERAYCANPVCVPSRFSMVTGRYPSEIGMRSNNSQEIPPIPQGIKDKGLGRLLRSGGYETFFGGKEHFPKRTRATEFGFEYIETNERDKLTDRSVEFLESRADADRPFCYVASFINPHDICYMAIRDFASSDFDRLLLDKGMVEVSTLEKALRPPEGVDRDTFLREVCPPLPDNFEPQEDEPEAIRLLQAQREFKQKARAEYSEEQWRMHRWAYARLTEMVDSQIGPLLETLERTGLSENTVVVFTSDHGDMDSSHRMEHKTALYEESAHVPFLVRGPAGSRRGVVDTEHLVSNGLDLVPTLCDYAGVEPPKDLRGRSVRPLVEGRTDVPWRDALMVESEIGRLLTTGRYKFVRYTMGSVTEQLYDIEEDPGEMHDHSQNPENADVVARHRGLLDRELQLSPPARGVATE